MDEFNHLKKLNVELNEQVTLKGDDIKYFSKLTQQQIDEKRELENKLKKEKEMEKNNLEES